MRDVLRRGQGRDEEEDRHLTGRVYIDRSISSTTELASPQICLNPPGTIPPSTFLLFSLPTEEWTTYWSY